MRGCCLAVLLGLSGAADLLGRAWLFSHWYNAFDSRLVAFLSWLFLPYTSLAWMYVYFNHGGQVQGGYLILGILAVLADLGVFSGGHQAMSRLRAA